MSAADGPRLIAVVAMAENGVIGREGRLPWRLSSDLRRFKSLTVGRPILMGRRTFESLGRALPDRQNIVLTRNPDWSADGCTIVRSLDGALLAAGAAPALMVIGGAEIYALCWPRLSRVELTRVHAHPPGDTFLTGLDWSGWRVGSEERHPADERNEYDYSFITLTRASTQD